jgi:hypothetical protein
MGIGASAAQPPRHSDLTYLGCAVKLVPRLAVERKALHMAERALRRRNAS